jgi:hypothetical protein
MSSFQILISLDYNQELIDLIDILEISQNSCLLGSFSIKKEISLVVPDIFLEIELKFHPSELFSTSVYLLPLLTDSTFCIDLKKDEKTGQFLMPCKKSEAILSLVFERTESFSIALPLTEAKKTSACSTESFGIDFDFPEFKEKVKYLEVMMTGLNSKLKIQEIQEFSSSFDEKLLKITETEQINQNKQVKNIEPSYEMFRSRDLEIPEKENNEKMRLEMNELRSKNLELDTLLLQMSTENIELKKQHSKCMSYEKLVSELENEIKMLRESLHFQEQTNESLKASLAQLIQNFEENAKEFENFKISQESGVENILKEKDLEILSLISENSLLKVEISKVLCEVESLNSEIRVKNFQENPRQASLGESVQNISEVIFNRIKLDEQKQQIENLLEKLRVSERKVTELEDHNKNQEDIIKLVSVNTQVSGTLEKCENNQKYMEEFFKILEEIEKIKETGNEFERKFYKDFSTFFKKVLKLSDLNLNLHRLFAKYFSLMYDKDCQLYMLRHIARDAQMQRQLYVPVKSDPIDVCMAEYINNRKTPLQIPLIREDQGVYNFYTRTIKVKIENNRVIVRLGGGFQGIDEFVNNNTQAELDKLEERRKFGCAEAVKKLIESDFQILGLPAPIDHLTPVMSNETSFSSNPNNSMIADNISPKGSKRGSFFKEIPKAITKKKTMT